MIYVFYMCYGPIFGNTWWDYKHCQPGDEMMRNEAAWIVPGTLTYGDFA